MILELYQEKNVRYTRTHSPQKNDRQMIISDNILHISIQIKHLLPKGSFTF